MSDLFEGPSAPADAQIVTIEPVTVAVVRKTVPMNQLGDFYSSTFQAVVAAAEAQGIALTGAPFGKYEGMPTDTADITAGFPTASPLADAGDVHADTLPGGRVIRALHRGHYDTLADTYNAIWQWCQAEGHHPSDVMWENYVNDPQDPNDAEVEIIWPLASS
ncbi:GyrI-like domain-containing protein [Kribbia dieselivorans]|uniref:GyrI-like domain-containing protein n=1 Tax=Kribbia dieselivorans TaxID=331526 RepID=UPI000838B5B5|nr:GyrI-like domain-containing protein [Kribbia dieselivorans]